MTRDGGMQATRRMGLTRRYWLRYWAWHFTHHPRLTWPSFSKWGKG